MPDPSESKPADAELCAQLGINPADLGSIPQRARASSSRRLPALPEPEDPATKEAVLTVLATYLSNKPQEWWNRLDAEREDEVFFVADALVRTYAKMRHL